MERYAELRFKLPKYAVRALSQALEVAHAHCTKARESKLDAALQSADKYAIMDALLMCGHDIDDQMPKPVWSAVEDLYRQLKLAYDVMTYPHAMLDELPDGDRKRASEMARLAKISFEVWKKTWR